MFLYLIIIYNFKRFVPEHITEKLTTKSQILQTMQA